VVTVEPDDDLDRILDLLVDDERDINRLPVVESGTADDGAGRLVGIIARQDVLGVIRDERQADD